MRMWDWFSSFGLNSDRLQAVGSILTTVITLFLLRAAWKHFKHERTSSYIERYNSAEFIEVRAAVDQFLYVTEKMTPAERGLVYRDLLLSDHPNDITFRHRLWSFAMIFNEIGAAWESRAIDACLIKNFDRLIPRYWMRLRPYMMNLHLRFGFEVPANLGGFEGKFKLFGSFREAYIRMQRDSSVLSWWRRWLLGLVYMGVNGHFVRPKIGIDPEDLQTSSLLSPENHMLMEKTMNGERPPGPWCMEKSVIESIRTTGKWTPPQSPPQPPPSSPPQP